MTAWGEKRSSWHVFEKRDPGRDAGPTCDRLGAAAGFEHGGRRGSGNGEGGNCRGPLRRGHARYNRGFVRAGRRLGARAVGHHGGEVRWEMVDRENEMTQAWRAPGHLQLPRQRPRRKRTGCVQGADLAGARVADFACRGLTLLVRTTGVLVDCAAPVVSQNKHPRRAGLVLVAISTFASIRARRRANLCFPRVSKHPCTASNRTQPARG